MVMLDVNGDESMGLTAESDDDTNDVMIVDTLQGIDDYDNYGDQDVYGIEGEMDSTIL